MHDATVLHDENPICEDEGVDIVFAPVADVEGHTAP